MDKFNEFLNGTTSESNLIPIIFEVKEKETSLSRKELYAIIKDEIRIFDMYNDETDNGVDVIKPSAADKFKIINDSVYAISHDEIDLSDADIVDIGVDLLQMVLLAIYDDSIKSDLHFDGLSDAEIKAYLDKTKSDADGIKKSLTGIIGDADKTAAFIKLRLKEIAAANDGGGVDE